MNGPLRVYSVAPRCESVDELISYHDRLKELVRQIEGLSWDGLLVPHNFHEIDPWAVASAVGHAGTTAVPLIAVQPMATPPHSAAMFAAAFVALYRRPLYFNLVSGAREDEMRRLGETLVHDERYQRLREYAMALRTLISGEALDVSGRFYEYRGYSLSPWLPALQDCRIFIAGSSESSLAIAVEQADVVVTHPGPHGEWVVSHVAKVRQGSFAGELGIRIGILARGSSSEAWEIARDRFPGSWKGRQETLLKTRSQSHWSRRLAELSVEQGVHEIDRVAESHTTYWLGAFASGLASAPFLVGSYDDVSSALSEYLQSGVRHLLLNGCETPDYASIDKVIRMACEKGLGSQSEAGSLPN